MKYPQYPSSPIALEEEILESWRREKLFEQTLKATSGKDEFFSTRACPLPTASLESIT